MAIPIREPLMDLGLLLCSRPLQLIDIRVTRRQDNNCFLIYIIIYIHGYSIDAFAQQQRIKLVKFHLTVSG